MNNNDNAAGNDRGMHPPTATSFNAVEYNSGSGSFSGTFYRRDSFGSSSSGITAMGIDDPAMIDDRLFSLDDNNAMQFPDPKNAPYYAEPEAMQTVNPMQIHPGSLPPEMTSEGKDFKHALSSGIPPIISEDEAKTSIPGIHVNPSTFAPEQNVGVNAIPNSLNQQQQQQQQEFQPQSQQQEQVSVADKFAAKPEPRKKLWKCTFPGCTEPPKTHYNCYSHVWDSHIRHNLPQDDPLGSVVYKKIADKSHIKELCKKYMIELDDVNRKRKRNKKGSPEQDFEQLPESQTNPILLDPNCGTVISPTNPPTGFALAAIGPDSIIDPSAKMSIDASNTAYNNINKVYTVNAQMGIAPPPKRLHPSNSDYTYEMYNPSEGSTIPSICSSNSPIKPEAANGVGVPQMNYPIINVQQTLPLQPQPLIPQSLQAPMLQQQPPSSSSSMMFNVQPPQPSAIGILQKNDSDDAAAKMICLNGNGIPKVVPLGTELPQQQQYFAQQGQASGSSLSSSSSSPVVASGGDTPISPGKIVVVPAASGCDTMAGVDHSYSLDQDGVTKIIVNSNGLARLYVCGEVFAEHGFLQRSDARFKEDIMPISGALNKVLQITGKTFKYKGDASSTTRMGFIAQELEEVVPTAVYRDEHGLSVDVVSLVPLILEALKEIYYNTLAVESEQAQILNEAVKDAMEKVQVLDKKFEYLRSSDDSSDDGVSSSSSDSSDDNEKSKHTEKVVSKTRKSGVNKRHKHSKGGSTENSKRSKIKKTNKTRESGRNTKTVQGDEYELGVKAKGSDGYSNNSSDRPFDFIFQNDKKESGHFRYKFSFGPPLVVLISTVLFLAAGIIALNLVRKMPFVWIYCFFSTAILIASLICQKDELIATFRNLEIKLYWRPENTLNSYFLAVIAIIGLVLTMILGLSSVICVGIMFFVLVTTWMFSVIAHNKYNVRIQSIFILCSGILVFMSCCFVFVYMAQPFQCEFDGYSGQTIEVPVYVGKDVNHIQIKSIPWNCFFSQIELSSPLPDLIRLNTESTLPFFDGYVNGTFDSVPIKVTMYCNQHQGFSCGTLVFQPCLSYDDELKCKTNGCSWCSGYGPNKTGTCGFCNRDFTAQCFESTGSYPSCVGEVVASGFNPLKPFKSLLLLLALLVECFL